MQIKNGWYLPDNDVQFASLENLDSYQERHRNNSFKHVKNFRVGIDIGAHIGIWSKPMSYRFDEVLCFEPVPMYYECLVKNVTNPNCTFFQVALADKPGVINLSIDSENSGNTHVSTEGYQCEVKTLDSLALDREYIDYIKLDVEGYEYFVLKGAVQILEKFNPIIHLEQKNHAIRYGIGKYQALDLLKELGYKELCRTVDDFTYGRG